MNKTKKKRLSIIGVVVGGLLIFAHTIHLPLILLGALGFVSSSLFTSVPVQTIGVFATAVVMFFFVKNKSTEVKTIGALLIITGLIFIFLRTVNM